MTSSTVSIAWDASKDNVGVAGYDVFAGGDRTGSVTATSYTFGSLACGVSLTVAVAAFDAAGNRSGVVSTTVSTAACSDTQPPTTPSGFRQEATTQDAVVLAWNQSTDNVGVVDYGVYRNAVQVAEPTDPNVTLTGLDCGSIYEYAIDAVDAAGNHSARGTAFAQTASCSDAQPPSTPGGLAVTGRTASSLAVGWSPSTDNLAVAGYRVSLDGSPVTTTAQTSANVTNLSCGSGYTIGVDAFDAAGNRSPAATVLGTTDACANPVDTQPPSTPILSLGPATQTSLDLRWQSVPDNVGVDHYNVWMGHYGRGDFAELVQVPVSVLSYVYSGLTCGTAYTLGLEAVDAAGNKSLIGEATSEPVSTLACDSPTPPNDTQPPTQPTSLAVTSASGSSISLRWSASTDNVGVAGYGVYLNGTRVTSTTQLTTTLPSLTCGSAYTIEVDAFDTAGNRSTRSDVIATTSACPDNQPPTVPTNVTASSRTGTSITLSWSPSSDTFGVVGYGLYRAGNLVGTASGTTGIFSGLTCNTSYTLAVDAYDAAGNRSQQAVVMVATTACADTTPPSMPTGLNVGNIAQTSLTLAWNPSTDNVAVAGYDVFAADAKVGSTSGTSYTVQSLACGSAYTLGVEAVDAAGNRSTRSTVSVSTTSCSGGTVRFPYRYMFSSGDDPAAAKSIGFSLIDVGSKSAADALPEGTQALVYLGTGAAWNDATCGWDLSDAAISNTVSASANDPKVAGYFFSDEPDPFQCPNAVAAHRARAALIRSLAPTKFSVMVIDSNSGQMTMDQIPMWVGVADYAGLDVYPCYQGRPCDFNYQKQVIAAADSAGLAYFGGVQAFRDASEWRWPTASELQTQLDNWTASKAKGYMLFAWTWAGYNLTNQPALVDVLQRFNSGGAASGDTTSPSTPTGLSAGAKTSTSIALSWNPSTDNVGVTGYDLFGDGGKVGGTAATSYTFGGLSCGTTYTLGVEAYDAAGNRSARASLGAATNACSGGGSDPVIAAAGDICASATDCAPTAALLGQLNPTRVLTLGDNAYPDGSPTDYQNYYQPNWGRYKATTSPAPGNHDYHTSGGSGYFGYFGAQAPAPYYSFDLGSWHLISLNGEISHSAGSAQETWLKADLAANPGKCVLAYWHEPRFSSGTVHGSNSSFDAFWRALYAVGADIVLNGHEHNYERFAPQNPDGAADTQGIRQFVAGTGGADEGTYPFGTPIANSQVRNTGTPGVLKLVLHPGNYDWQFLPATGFAFTDSGSGSC